MEADYSLGKALADQSRAAEAIKHYQKAIDLAGKQGNTALANAVRTQLKLYEANSSDRKKR